MLLRWMWKTENWALVVRWGLLMMRLLKWWRDDLFSKCPKYHCCHCTHCSVSACLTCDAVLKHGRQFVFPLSQLCIIVSNALMLLLTCSSDKLTSWAVTIGYFRYQPREMNLATLFLAHHLGWCQSAQHLFLGPVSDFMLFLQLLHCPGISY